jgi:hypothetical protein
MQLIRHFVSYLLIQLLAVLVVALPMWPQNRGATGLSVRVQPEARMIVEVVDRPRLDSPLKTIRWFQVDLTVRVHSGATAALFLEQVPRQSGPHRSDVPPIAIFARLPGATSLTRRNIADSRSLFTAEKNGRFSLLVGIGIDDPVRKDEFPVESIRFIFKSSDGSFDVTKTILMKESDRGIAAQEF